MRNQGQLLFMVRNNSILFYRLTLLTTICLFLIAFPAFVFAGEFTVFGPQNYVRATGEPVTVTNNFSVLNPNTEFILRIYNGGLQDIDTELVSSSIIAINGKQVVGPEKFNQNIRLIETPVTLQSNNTIEVEMRGKPGGVLTIRIFGIDNVAPNVQIIDPPDGSSTNINPYNIKLTFDDDISGINPSSFKISINDVDKTDTFTITPTGLSGSASGTVLLSEGINTINASISDFAGNASSTSATVTLQALLEVKAEANPGIGYAPLPVSFSATTQGTITLYEWDFNGDGTYDWSSPSSPNTVYTYTQLGTFNATIRVTDSTGAKATHTLTITVQNPLTATANASPTSGTAPLKVTFTGSGIDQTGTIIKYEWDFNGDGFYDWSSAFSQNAYYTYSTAGTYNAKLRLTDNNGFIDTDSITVTVNPAPPVATALATPTSGGVPLTVNFTGTGTDPDGTITKYEWDFDGDGTYDWSSTTTANTSYTYNTTGTYNATLKVTDNDGLTNTDLIVITASQPGSPTASASANPTKGKAPLTVNFSGTATDSDGYITLYEWDFDGDGTYDWSTTAVPQDPFKDDVEAGPGAWTATGLWHRSQHRSQSGSWAWYYGQEDKWNYDTGTTNYGYLTSSVIDLTGVPSPLLTFWRWYQTQSGTYYDRKYIQISTDGGTSWTTLRQISTYPGTWVKEEIDLSAYTNKKIQIRFYFNTIDARYNYYEGWYIDDISITQRAMVSHTYNEAGHYDAVFRATDNSGLTATALVPIDVDYNISLSISPDSFNPSKAETTNLNTTLFGGDIKFTVLIKDKNANIIKTLVNEQPRGNGSYTDTWNGIDDQGNIVPDGVYYFVIEYITKDGKKHTYDLTTTTGGTQRTLGGYSASFPSTFSPYDDQFCPITYNVPYKGEVTAYICPFYPAYSGEKIKALLERVPQGKGYHTVYWDGTNDQGQMAPPASPSYLVAIWSWDLPDNSVITTGTRPEITNVSAEPNYFDPSYHSDEPVGYRPTTVTYTLSKNANVTLKVYDLNNVLIRTITKTNIPAGTNTLAWDGRNSSGNLVTPGQYKLGIKAIDSEGNESVTMFCHVVVFY